MPAASRLGDLGRKRQLKGYLLHVVRRAKHHALKVPGTINKSFILRVLAEVGVIGVLRQSIERRPSAAAYAADPTTRGVIPADAVLDKVLPVSAAGMLAGAEALAAAICQTDINLDIAKVTREMQRTRSESFRQGHLGQLPN